MRLPIVNRTGKPLVVSVSLLALICVCSAADLNVPSGPYPTISSAVTAASPGDRVLVAPGTYNENVVVNKQLTIEGAGTSTVIDGGASPAVVYTAGGSSSSARQILKNVQTQSTGHIISVRGDVSFLTFDGVTVKFVGMQTAAAPNIGPQANGLSFDNSSGVWTPFTSGSPANQSDILITGCTFQDNYYNLWISENMTNLRVENSKFLGGWMGFFLWNGNLAGSVSSAGPVGNRTTNNITIDNCLFYDQGVKGIYVERGNNFSVLNTSVVNCGNRSGRSLPTNDPRGLEMTGNGGVGDGIDVNLCGSGPATNMRFYNVNVAYCAIRDRQLSTDPTAPGQTTTTFGIGAGVSIKGRLHRGGSYIDGLFITNSTFAHNKIAIAFPQVDIQNNVGPGNPGTVGVDKGNGIKNALLANNNFWANTAKAIRPESSSFPSAGEIVVPAGIDVSVIAGYPTTTGWDSTGYTVGSNSITLDGSYYNSTNGPAGVPGSGAGIGTGDAISTGIYLSGYIGGRVASTTGRMVDLAGTYTGPSSGPVGASSQPGRAAAATGATVVGSQTFEMSGTNVFGANASGGSFQPFNATSKLPKALTMPNPVGSTTFTSVVQLNDPSQWNAWSWSPATGDTFSIGVTNNLNSGGVQFVKDSSGSFRARMYSENNVPRTTLSDGNAVVGAVAGNDATSPVMPGSTRFQVVVATRQGEMEGWVTPLDGTLVGRTQYLGTISKTNMNTNFPWTLVLDNMGGFPAVSTYYAAGFVNHQTEMSRAQADVVSFRTAQDLNVFSAFAVDPYVRGSESVNYLLGGANFDRGVYGYQGTLQPSGATTPLSFLSNAYPFPQVIFDPVSASMNYAAGVATNMPGPDFDAVFAAISMASPGASGTAAMTPLSTFVGSLAARYSDSQGSPVPSLSLVASNTVVADNSAPAITPVSLTLLPGTSISATGGGAIITTGSYHMVTTVADTGATPAGLLERPTYSWDFGNDGSVEIGPTPMAAGTGNNFQADFNVLNSYTNGTAKLTIQAVDRAGNVTTQDYFYTLNTTTVTINFTVPSDWAGKPMWVHVRLGGSGGSNGPYDYHRSVLIGAGGAGQLVLDALNTASPVALPLAPNNITQFSVKAMPYSLRVNGSLSGTIDKVGNAGTLRFGDANGDNLIDILDYAYYAVNYNSAETPAAVGLADGTAPNGDGVLLPVGSRRADFSGNALVFTEDFTYFAPFPATGDPISGGPGGFRGDGRGPKMTMTLREAENAGVPAKVASRMDADHNGIITLDEIANYMRRMDGR